MARRKSSSYVVAVAVLLLLQVVREAHAQFGGMPKKEVKIIPARKEDIKYVQCSVCEAVVKASVKHTKAVKENVTAKHKFSEADILDKLESMCKPDLEPGEWINSLSIAHEDNKLKVVEMGQMGKCDTDCRTIARICNDIMEETDLTDFSPLLYKGKKRSELTQYLCYDSTDACTKKIPAVPKDRKPSSAFQPMDSEEVTRYKMLRTMKENGMSGTMYDRDSILDEMEMMKEEMGDDFPGEFDQDMQGAKESFAAEAEAEGGGLGADIGKAAGAVKDAAGKMAGSAKKMAEKMYNKIIGGGGEGEL